MNELMTPQLKKPEIPGTRTGYVIRFTCPACAAENTIVSKTQNDHDRETRNATCTQCRVRSLVLTPRMNRRPGYSPVSAYVQWKTL
jgi:transcription elongation factor Elf1